MRFTEAKPFTVDEIAEKFEELEKSPMFWRTVTTESHDHEQLKDENGDWVFIERDELPKKVVEERKPLNHFGYQYGWKSWMRRVLSDNSGSHTPRPWQKGELMRDYLHSRFRWRRQVCSFDGEPSPDEGKDAFQGRNVTKYWLSSLFGFMKYKGSVVQVNPAELFAIHWVKKHLKEGQELRFDKVISEVRIIPVSDGEPNWVFNQFQYYFKSILGLNEFNNLGIRGLRPDVSPEHLLVKGAEDMKYLVQKAVPYPDLLQNLYELGSVVDFGYDPQLDSRMGDLKMPISDIRKMWKDSSPSGSNYEIFTGGSFHGAIKYPLVVEDKVALSPHLQDLAKYLRTFARKQFNEIALATFKEDLRRNRVYSETTVVKKRFLDDVVIPEAKELGFDVVKRKGRILNPETGEKSQAWLISVTQPKYGRSKK